MTKKSKKGSYSFTLGPKASIFFDPQSGVKVLPNKITEFDGRMTNRLQIALSNKHILNLNEDEKEELQGKLDNGLPIFQNMNKGDLVMYYSDNFQVSDEEVSDFSSKNKGKMVEYLQELTEDDDE